MSDLPDRRLVRPAWRGRSNVDALTIACVEHAERLHGHQFVVTQGSYQAGAGDSNSAGTHDRGGVVDLRWCGHGDAIRCLRQAGMAAWHRTPEQGPWPHHVHAVVIGHPRLHWTAANQVQDYLSGRNGLANNGPDTGPRLDPIPRPVWPPNTGEDPLIMTDDDEDRIARIVAEEVAAALRVQNVPYLSDGKRKHTTLPRGVGLLLDRNYHQAPRFGDRLRRIVRLLRGQQGSGL